MALLRVASQSAAAEIRLAGHPCYVNEGIDEPLNKSYINCEYTILEHSDKIISQVERLPQRGYFYWPGVYVNNK